MDPWWVRPFILPEIPYSPRDCGWDSFSSLILKFSANERSEPLRCWFNSGSGLKFCIEARYFDVEGLSNVSFVSTFEAELSFGISTPDLIDFSTSNPAISFTVSTLPLIILGLPRTKLLFSSRFAGLPSFVLASGFIFATALIDIREILFGKLNNTLNQHKEIAW